MLFLSNIPYRITIIFGQMHKKTMKNILLKIFQGCQGIRRIMISKFLASKPKQTNLSNDIKPQNLMVLDIFVLRCCILFANFLPLIKS